MSVEINQKTNDNAAIKPRHEWKYGITFPEYLTLKHRLSAVMQPDSHSINGIYQIRSLYFDNLRDKALMEKIDGVNNREKFRIRYYNGNADFLMLEKKSKKNGLCTKVQARLTKEEAQKIVTGDITWMKDAENKLIAELYAKMLSEGLRPKTIVDYTREAFLYGPGNVRVTLDHDIRSGLSCTDFLDVSCPTVPVGDDFGVLEVKWDEFLPEVVRLAASLPNLRPTAFSKYAICRIYG